jgi:hypothetical protein
MFENRVLRRILTSIKGEVGENCIMRSLHCLYSFPSTIRMSKSNENVRGRACVMHGKKLNLYVDGRYQNGS